MKMLESVPVVARDTSWPPTTPRGSSWGPPGLITFMGRTLGRHAGELPAGDVQRLPVDVVAPRRAQEEHAAGGFLRRARAAQRDQHRRHAAHLVGNAELHRLAVDLHLVGVV